MTVRGFVRRAVKLAVVVLIVCTVAVAAAMFLGAWAEASPGSRQHSLNNALVLVVYVVAIPTIPIAGWIKGPDLLEASVALTMGSLVWGALLAVVWCLATAARRLVRRAIALAAVVFIACGAAFATAAAIRRWAEADPNLWENPLVDATLRVYMLLMQAVAMPPLRVTERMVGYDLLGALGAIAIGSLAWGIVLATAWSALDWLRRHRRGAGHDASA